MVSKQVGKPNSLCFYLIENKTETRICLKITEKKINKTKSPEKNVQSIFKLSLSIINYSNVCCWSLLSIVTHCSCLFFCYSIPWADTIRFTRQCKSQMYFLASSSPFFSFFFLLFLKLQFNNILRNNEKTSKLKWNMLFMNAFV